MTNLDIAQRRVGNQHIARQTFKKPADIVKYLGAVQAQDFAGAKWALGLRLQKSSDKAIDKALADGSIIRTHVLRPTWHFVSPADARWMIELTAPRIIAFSASRNRQLQLDNAVFKKSNDALAKALEGRKQLNRTDIMAVLQQAGIATNDLRFIHLLMRAELDKVICSGGRQGKQFTYAFFDDRVPAGNTHSKEAALAELATRYFLSRGPATLQDFAWWSGLAAADARVGLEIVKPGLTNIKIEGAEYWMGREEPIIFGKAPVAHLLPAFDEFAVAYKDRTAAVNSKYLKQARNVISDPSIVVNNQVVGTWKRILEKNAVEIVLNPFGKLNKAHTIPVEAAAERYRKFSK
jgi:hypothetical protein